MIYLKRHYDAVKQDPSESNILEYTNAVKGLLETDATSYAANLKYIVSSSIGVSTIPAFIEKHGMPIQLHRIATEFVEAAIDKLTKLKSDTSKHSDVLNYLENYRNKYERCFTMYERCVDEDKLPSNHIAKFYQGLPNMRHYSMLQLESSPYLEEFGNGLISEWMIYIEQFGLSLDDAFVKFSGYEGTDMYNQWLSYIAGDFNESLQSSTVQLIKSKSLDSKVSNIIRNKSAEIRESNIMFGESPDVIYYESEINAIRDLISFKEYIIVTLDSSDAIMECQREIYDLYNEMNGLIDDDSESVNETASHWGVARTQKTGQAPAFLSRNHDMQYGEEEPKKKEDEDKSPEDYKRPPLPESQPEDVRPVSSHEDPDTMDIDEDDKPSTAKDGTPVTNNYYYQYTNSYNKNQNSHNTSKSHDNSHHSSIDNSVKNINRSQNVDNSHNKQIGTSKPKQYKDDIYADDEDDVMEESVFPILPSLANPFVEKEEESEDTTGDADDNKPKSDHPIKDALLDIDRKLVAGNQKAKKVVQDTVNTGKAFIKPAKRTTEWINSQISVWRDLDETKTKEKMADPKNRNVLYKAIGTAIKTGSLVKAGLLFNPLFVTISVLRKFDKNSNEFRIRNEMIGEIKTEMEVLDLKIENAKRDRDDKALYELTRFKNTLQKKLIRVGGPAKRHNLAKIL